MNRKHTKKQRDKLDHTIDRIGFGYFQIISMFGLGSRVFAHGSILSLTAMLEPYLRCVYELSPFSASYYLTGYFMSAVLASWTSGYISDTYGKRKTIILMCSMSAFIASLHTLSQSFTMLVITISAFGLFENATFLVYPYLLEVFPISKRKYLPLMETFYVLGFLSGVLVTYWCLKYATWQIAIIISVILPSFIVITFAWFMPESPSYWFLKRDRKALAETLFQMMRKNNVKFCMEEIFSIDKRQFTIDNLQCTDDSSSDGDSDEDNELGQLLEKTKSHSSINHSDKRNSSLLPVDILPRVLLTSVIRFTACLCRGMLVYASGQRYALNPCSECHVNIGITNLISTCLGFSASILISYNLVNYCRRRITLLILLTMLSLLAIPFYFEPSHWILATLIFVSSVCADCLLVVLLVYTSEVVPTSVRGLNIGMSIGSGFFGELCAALLTTWVLHVNLILSLNILQGIIVICLVIFYFFGIETKDVSLN